MNMTEEPANDNNQGLFEPCNTIQDFQALVEAAGLTRRYRYRADGMSYALLEKMLQCIFDRRHIIIHQTPGNQRARKLAWSEITSIMSQHFPKETEDLGGYLRRKWDNLLQGTKKKIRMGYTTRESGWNEQNELLMKFFAEYSSKGSPQSEGESNIRNSLYFLDKVSTSNTFYGSQEQDSIYSEMISQTSCSSMDGSESNPMITPNDLIQKILALSSIYAKRGQDETDTNQNFNQNTSPIDHSQQQANKTNQSEIAQEINEQLLDEHRMRMKILRIQNHYWQLQLRMIHSQTVNNQQGASYENLGPRDGYQDMNNSDQDVGKAGDVANISSNNSTTSPANSFSQFNQNS